MSRAISLPTNSFFARVKGALTRATTMDPIAVKMIEDTYVSVHLSSRIWMV
jgi:hypothetical protein